MEKLLLLSLFISLFIQNTKAQQVTPFELHDAVSNEPFSLENHQNTNAVVLVFTTFGCPFSKLYEERILQLHQRYAGQNIRFALINPHVNIEMEDSEEAIDAQIKDKKQVMPYLLDREQKVAKMLQVTKSPEAIVITHSPTGFAVAYRGAIDNNPQLPQHATKKHLEKAIKDILAGKNPSPTSTRPTGCNIKYRH